MNADAEDGLHVWLRRRAAKLGFHLLGDDGAVLRKGGPWVVTQDQQIEGVHFPSGLDPALVARRLLRVNLSDLAAMGAKPAYAFLALSCPLAFGKRRFLQAFLDACAEFGVELAGGDLARDRRVGATLTLIGSRPKGGRWLARNSGVAGDRLWLAGKLGHSAVGQRLLAIGARAKAGRIELPTGLHLPAGVTRLAKDCIRLHLLPQPQLLIGEWLGRRRRATAIDLSDGLAIDLHRLCRASGTGATLMQDNLPRSDHFIRLCHSLDLDPDKTVLSGGEDYSLLFALPPRIRPPEPLHCRQIGSLKEDRSVGLQRQGREVPLPADGWDHFRDDTPGR